MLQFWWKVTKSIINIIDRTTTAYTKMLWICAMKESVNHVSRTYSNCQSVTIYFICLTHLNDTEMQIGQQLTTTTKSWRHYSNHRPKQLFKCPMPKRSVRILYKYNFDLQLHVSQYTESIRMKCINIFGFFCICVFVFFSSNHNYRSRETTNKTATTTTTSTTNELSRRHNGNV